MADCYLLESGAPDGYLLEDSSGVLLLEDTLLLPFRNPELTNIQRKTNVLQVHLQSSPLNTLYAPENVVLRAPVFFNPQRKQPVVLDVFPNVLLLNPPAAPPETRIATAYPESLPVVRRLDRFENPVFPNLLLSTLNRASPPFFPTVHLLDGVQRKQNLNEDVYYNTLLNVLIPDGITGNAAVTIADDTVSANGTTTIVGTLARTNSNDTVVSSGTTTIVGTASPTNANDTVSANGTVGGGVDGTANVTAQNDTVSSSGTTTVVGSANITSQNDTVSSSGTTTVVGSLAKTNNNDSVSAFGIVGTPPTVTTYLPLTGAGK